MFARALICLLCLTVVTISDDVQVVRKVRSEAEKGFDLERVKSQVEESFKQSELEMNEKVQCEYTMITFPTPHSIDQYWYSLVLSWKVKDQS